MKEQCFDSQRLSQAIQENAVRRSLPQARLLDSAMDVEPGSVLARRLADYLHVLGNNIHPNFLEIGRRLPADFTLVDAGCGAGLALSEMRDLFPQARLIGIDERDVRFNRIMWSKTRVGDIMKTRNIDFRHGDLLSMNQVVPEGYDLLLNLGVFYERSDNMPLLAEGLKGFYDGLRPGGQAFVHINQAQSEIDRIQTCFDSIGASFQFVPTDKKVLERTHLDFPTGVTGTAVLGPKPQN